MTAALVNLVNAAASLIGVRALLILGGGGVASWLAIDGTLDPDAYLAAITALSGAYVGGRFAQGSSGGQ